MNFAAARTNMVDSQIHTMGVVNEDILNAFRTTPRELFVPKEKQGIAYMDEDMPIGRARFLMEPVTHARLLQAASPVAGDSVLDIGCGTGYSTAVIAQIAGKVVAVEADNELLAKAEANWKALGCNNVLQHCGPAYEGCATHGPYSLIIVNGSMAGVPEALLDQIAPNGRLLTVIKTPADKIGHAVMLLKSESGAISERVLFNAAVPYIPGFEPKRGFVF